MRLSTAGNGDDIKTAGNGDGFGGRRMTKIGIKGLAVMAALALGAPAEGWALTPQAGVTIGIANMVVAQATQSAPADSGAPAAAAAPAADAGGLSDATKQGIGCLATSGSLLAYSTFWAGATESLMIAAGGLLSPASTPTLWLGLASTVAVATCSLGAAATPFVLWAAEQKDNIAANFAWRVERTGNELASLFAAPAAARQVADRAQ